MTYSLEGSSQHPKLFQNHLGSGCCHSNAGGPEVGTGAKVGDVQPAQPTPFPPPQGPGQHGEPVPDWEVPVVGPHGGGINGR